jgi:4-amino-4-deoxy-L-arabinose transferase-like glycosyltransferase
VPVAHPIAPLLTPPARSEPRPPAAHYSEPAWSRPALIFVTALAAALMLLDVTRSGYGNSYYATGALAASHSWSALFNNAADLGGFVSLDKGPLPDWLMGLSGRVFGFSSLSVMLPSALYGIATVVVLHDAVRRALGHEIAILAALIMALTPVAVLVGRYNAPDALLLALLVGAAWSVTVAVQTGRLRELVLCAILVGLAFNTKMLEAYLVAPALGLAYLLTARRSLRRRLLELALAACLTLFVSLLWFAGTMLVPASGRPYVGESSDNSWFQLILGGNGVERVTGSAGAFGRHLEGNLLYLSSAHVSGQIAWLLPLAPVGLVLGLFKTRRSPRTGFAFGSYLLWGTWLLVSSLVLSFSAGTRHAYYTSLLAPAVATLAAAALVTLWRSARASPTAASALALSILGTSAVSFAILTHAPGFVPWLRWVVLAGGAVAGAAILTRHRSSHHRASVTLVVIATAVASLAGPAAYSLASAARSHSGYDPIAGPGPPHRAPAPAAGRSTELTQPQSLALLTSYLLTHRDHTRFVVAATDAKTADPIALASRQAVITIGGFSGSDPAPTAGQLAQLVGSAQLRYVLLDASRVMPTQPEQRAVAAPAWVQRHCSLVPSTSITSAPRTRSPHVQARIYSELTLFECNHHAHQQRRSSAAPPWRARVNRRAATVGSGSRRERRRCASRARRCNTMTKPRRARASG